MLCQLCNKREATVVITTTTGDGIGGLVTAKKMEKHYCEQCILSPNEPAKTSATKARPKPHWKQVDDSTAAVSFYLTGESVVRAVTIPSPPSSKTPTIVRVSHSNCYGPVDSDVFVRLGNPKKPLGVQDFDTVSDWREAELVEDLTESGDGGWKARGKAKGNGSYWSGTYEVEIQFPKGQHQIEIKIISRVEQVCSIVLSNWKVNVR
jgi:hypothetical protein